MSRNFGLHSRRPEGDLSNAAIYAIFALVIFVVLLAAYL